MWVALLRQGCFSVLDKHFGLGLTAVSDHFQSMRLVKCQLLQTSGDDYIRALYSSMKSRETKGRKWRPSRMLTNVDTEVDLMIHFPVQEDRAGRSWKLQSKPF